MQYSPQNGKTLKVIGFEEDFSSKTGFQDDFHETFLAVVSSEAKSMVLTKYVLKFDLKNCTSNQFHIDPY